MQTAIHEFSANVRRVHNTAIIDLSGEINGTVEQSLNAAYAEAANQQSNAILLNFTHVDYINSTGIALIVGLLAQARKARQQLLTFGLSAHYQQIFQITRLSDFMAIYPDETTALASTPR